ncbi:baseplate J/gp47 family protein [Commensalibacter oyaizuii]|uniref:Baseplate J/gp47 family protein n=1 Tax=Commensalibacter oyaizuii TaxID=3043873 RepID=A0ABT6Q3D9_9PROT|nr:baseplate J/gp47 family protein [Commensalibacter sp. TBRC 16381]MDI2091633.1 baseplate J/gp47 family protein [Commensalibacter sp. TBRC 16381]
MPFVTPNLTELNEQVIQDIVNAGIPGIETTLKNSVIGTIGQVQAGLSWQHYFYLNYISRQAVPWTATDEYLAGWGNLKNVFQKAPSKATATVQFNTIDGITIPKGTIIKRPDGWSYVTVADSVNGQALVESVDTGINGNVGQGVTLSLGNPLAGVDSKVIAITPITGGAELEDEEAYRQRVIEAYRISGSVGREQEYILWAKSVSQVSRAWIGRNGFGIGTVIVWIMCDQANTSTNGFPVGSDGSATDEYRYNPATGDQLAVANYIWKKQPVTALVIVCSPIAQPVNFVISDLGVNNTAANQDVIKAALTDMFRREAAPGTALYPSSWERAIGSITNISQYHIASPTEAVIPPSKGHLPILGEVTFST